MTEMSLKEAEDVLAADAALAEAREVKARDDRKRSARKWAAQRRNRHVQLIAEGESVIAALLACQKTLAAIRSRSGGPEDALYRWGGDDKAANLIAEIDKSLPHAEARLKRERAKEIQ
jgi:hypothetical protein